MEFNFLRSLLFSSCLVISLASFTLAKDAPNTLSALDITTISDNEKNVSMGSWTLIWKLDEESVIAVSASDADKKPCTVIKKGSALPNLTFWKIGPGTQILVYGEALFSDLRLVDMATCKITESSPGLNTKFSKNGFWTPVECGDSAYPHLVENPDGPSDCRSARVYRYDSKKHDFKIDEQASRSETQREVGLTFYGKAVLKNLEKLPAKRVK